MTIKGKTYSLFGGDTDTDQYYGFIAGLTDQLLELCDSEKTLLAIIQRAGGSGSLIKMPSFNVADRRILRDIRKTLKASLSAYTSEVKQHLKSLPLSQRFDHILRTREYQYHLYMIEIELVNRIYRDDFRRSDYKFALIAHCLRDFRPECKSVAGDYESICRRCTRACYVHLGSALLEKYGIHPYISVSIDLEKLFRQIKAEHDHVGALGIACVPELAQGMRLCIKMKIPPLGIPLDANRCARWMNQCRESSFNLKELEKLIK